MRSNVFSAVFIIAAALLTPTSHAAESYLDMTLERAISVALEQNKDVTNAKEDAIKASLQITEAASAAYPSINGQWNLDRTLKQQVFVIEFPDEDGNITKNRLKVGTDHVMTLGASLTQPIWLGGKVGTALKAAKIYRNLSEETYATVQHNIVSGVATAFYTILLADEMVRITRESLDIAEKHLDNVTVLHEAGSATDYDLLRAKVNVANLKPQVIDAENNVKISLLNFKHFLGVDPDTTVTISGELSEPDTTLFDRAQPTTALKLRPDMEAARLGVDIQDKYVRIALGDFLPNLTAGTTFAYVGNFDTFKYTPEDWTPYWYATVTLSFPIFSGFRNQSKYQQAKVDYRKAQTDFRKTRDSIVIEVDESVMNLRKAVEQIESQRMNVQEAEKAVELAESLYANGKATQLEVLDAQLALEQSRTNYATTLYEGKVAEVTLKKALGIIDTDNMKGTN